MLEAHGHVVTVANNGIEALRSIEKNCYDLILMDCHMPELDGFETTVAIRKKELATNDHIFIIALTASARSDEQWKWMDAGMDGCLSKPLVIEEFEQMAKKMSADTTTNHKACHTAEAVSSAPHDENVVVFDKTSALEKADNSEELLKNLAEVFIEHTPEYISELNTAIITRDQKQIMRSAHKIKGAALNFGKCATSQTAAKLESLTEQTDFNDVQEIFKELVKDIRHLENRLKELAQPAD